jgi:hypothetical protein
MPDDDRVEEVVRVPLRERGAVFGDGVDVLADAEDDALAERRRRLEEAHSVLQEGVDRAVGEAAQVFAAPVAAPAGRRGRVERGLEGGVGDRPDVVEVGPQVLERVA